MTADRTRRGILLGVGSISTVAVAGCLGGNDGETDAEGTPISEHPVSRDIGAWPNRGPNPVEAPATLVVLDDPSCSRCAAFHQNAISELTTNYVSSGDLSIAIRPYPVVYDWGEPAAHALEATIDREEAVFWELLDHYFETQSAFDASNVLDRTETWLDDNTDLDAAAVVDDAREEAFADRIESTLEAGEEAGAGDITPATFAFSDGELQTSLNGSQSVDTIETVLGL
jgi:protein-disulfide isomerase